MMLPIREIVIRTDENNPQCLRVAVTVFDEEKFSQHLAVAIFGYFKDIGIWPTIEQICNTIYRYTKDK